MVGLIQMKLKKYWISKKQAKNLPRGPLSRRYDEKKWTMDFIRWKVYKFLLEEKKESYKGWVLHRRPDAERWKNGMCWKPRSFTLVWGSQRLETCVSLFTEKNEPFSTKTKLCFVPGQKSHELFLRNRPKGNVCVTATRPRILASCWSVHILEKNPTSWVCRSYKDDSLRFKPL